MINSVSFYQSLLSIIFYKGNPCGEGQTAKYPYLYFIENERGFFVPNNTVCVTKCPNEKSSSISCAPDYNGEKGYCGNIKTYPTVACNHFFILC